MNYLYPLNAIHSNGRTKLLYTLEEVHKFIAEHGRFYTHHVESYFCLTGYGYREFKTNGWIVRDDRGRIVTYEDVCVQIHMYYGWNKRNAEIRKIAENGLPIPYTGCRKAGRKMNHTAKKNSGSGHRNRNRALCEYDRKAYGIRNNYGKVIPWEHY